MSNELSEIQKFYKGSTVFVTGVTGFVGKVLIEKILRTCDVNELICLVRDKKGVTKEERLDKLLNTPCFDKLKKCKPNFKSKLRLMNGDCCSPNLGLTDELRTELVKCVNVVIHCAATIRFNEPLRNAYYTNSRSTKDLLSMCKEMSKLKAMVHVSTAYSNSTQTRREIKEQFYEQKVSPQLLENILNNLDDKIIADMTPALLDDAPNTYTFTKAMAENIIRIEGAGLPVTIVRPPIVMPSANEPIPGWIDSWMGATAILLGIAMGLIRVVVNAPDGNAEIIPVDYVTNSVLASAWDVDKKKKTGELKNEIPILNCVLTYRHPIVWDTYFNIMIEKGKQIPSVKTVWHHWFFYVGSRFSMKLLFFLLHLIPAYIIDGIIFCMGKDRWVVKSYEKLHDVIDLTYIFASSKWLFHDCNFESLWKNLSPADKKLFCFDVEGLNWDEYIANTIYGGRVFLLKDPIETLPEGRIWYRKLRIINNVIVLFLALIVLYLIKFIFWQ